MTRRSALKLRIRIVLQQILNTMPRKRRSTGNKVDSKSNLKQVRFTPPKRTIKERGPTWSAPSKYQQTITQMNPSIYVPEPEYEGLTTDDDQEQESYIVPPGRGKRRKITPAKTSSRTTGNRSAQRQTITQMVPFRALYHPELEEENLDDLEDEYKENNVPSPMKKRKRKVSPENAPSGKIKKRRHKRVLSQVEQQPGHETEYDGRQQIKQSIPSKQKNLGEILHPPVTPRSRRKEIPSSQSPADTPLSLQSRRSFRAYTRSPLKERSTNIAPATTSRRDGAQWGRKVEIADSLESRENESPVLMRASTSVAARSLHNRSESEGKCSQVRTHSTVTRTAGLDYISDDWQWEETQRKDSYQDTLRREIVDSDGEDEGNHDTNPVWQATLHSKDTSPTQQRAPGHQRDRFSAARSSSSPESQQQSNLQNRHSIETSGLTKHISPNPALSPPSIPTFPRTDSEQVSAQLFNDLRRVTEPTLETESQFEAGWHSYHPPSLPSSPPAPIASPSSPAMTIPTQPLPPHTTAAFTQTQPNTSTQLNLPVPPSQATTTDTTQPSPRRLPSSQFQFLPSPSRTLPTTSSRRTAAAVVTDFPSSSPPSMPPPSSPPPMPPPPSSSLGVGESTAMGFQWNGVRLTDSQLLPESLLNDDSLIGVGGGWGFSQEGDLEEDE